MSDDPIAKAVPGAMEVVKESIITDTKALLQQHFNSIQAKLAEYKAPLEQARAARDEFVALNVRTFEERERLDTAIAVLQSDPVLSELEQALSATAKALGGIRMTDGALA